MALYIGHGLMVHSPHTGDHGRDRRVGEDELDGRRPQRDAVPLADRAQPLGPREDRGIRRRVVERARHAGDAEAGDGPVRSPEALDVALSHQVVACRDDRRRRERRFGRADRGIADRERDAVERLRADRRRAMSRQEVEPGNVFYDDFTVAGSFSTTTQLAFQRGLGFLLFNSFRPDQRNEPVYADIISMSKGFPKILAGKFLP